MDPRLAKRASDHQVPHTPTRRTAKRVAAALGLIVIVAAAIRISTIPLGDPATGTNDPRISMGATDRPGTGLQIGMVAPEFADASDDGLSLLTDLDGRRVRLSDFANRPVWIVFWATWCAPCQQEAIDILAVSHAHAGDGLIVLAVDEQEPAAAVRQYASENQLDYHIGLDTSGAVKTMYGGPGLPTHFFLGPDHVITGRYIGQMTRDLMERHLAAIIGQPTGRGRS